MTSSGCGAFLMKAFLVIFNAIFLIAGAGLVFLGVWLNWYNDSWNEYLEIINFVNVDVPNTNVDKTNEYMQYVLYAAIGIGVFVFLLSLLGCCGAIKGNSCMLATYGAVLLIILLGEAAVVALSVLYKDTVSTELQNEMKKQVENQVKVFSTNDSVGLSHAWHAMQKEMKCCGSYNYTDYTENANFNQTVNPVPVSCCSITTPADVNICYQEAMNMMNATNGSTYLYTQGCYDSLLKWINEYLWIFIAGAGGLLFLQLVAVIFACCLRSHHEKNNMA